MSVAPSLEPRRHVIVRNELHATRGDVLHRLAQLGSLLGRKRLADGSPAESLKDRVLPARLKVIDQIRHREPTLPREILVCHDKEGEVA